MRIRSVLVMLSFAALAAAPRAEAQCAGFSDVPFTQPFCGHVTWLKNRQVTLGCTSATLYCPDSPVARLSMAAFVNRVAEVATPRVFSIEDSGGALNLLTDNALCVTNIPPLPYARNVLLDAALSYEVSSLAGMKISIFKSVNGGPYTIAGSGQTRPIAKSTRRNHHPVGAWGLPTGLTIGPNEAHQYAVAVGTFPPQAITISGWTCNLQVVVLQKFEL